MITGIHAIHQRSIIQFFRHWLRGQFWAMIGNAVAILVLASAFIFRPTTPGELLAVALVQTPAASGSGFLVSDQLLLTTARITGGQTTISVLFPNQPPATGKVLFTDRERDIALVELKDIIGLKPLPLGTSDALAPGEEVELVGYQADTYTVARAALNRRSSDLFETGIPSTPGLSGGPLIRRADGSVVGMAISTPELGGPANQGKHRAVPITLIDAVCRQHGKPIR